MVQNVLDIYWNITFKLLIKCDYIITLIIIKYILGGINSGAFGDKVEATVTLFEFSLQWFLLRLFVRGMSSSATNKLITYKNNELLMFYVRTRASVI